MTTQEEFNRLENAADEAKRKAELAWGKDQPLEAAAWEKRSSDLHSKAVRVAVTRRNEKGERFDGDPPGNSSAIFLAIIVVLLLVGVVFVCMWSYREMEYQRRMQWLHNAWPDVRLEH